VKIIFWGTPDYSLESLKLLIDSNHEIKAVVSQPDKKRSRGKNLVASPVKKYAVLNNIPVLTPDKIINNNSFVKALKSFNSDVFIVIAYGKILSKEILDIPRYGSWNAHASLLPRWRGAAPIQWSLLKGDLHTGVGIMKMEEGLDTGAILIEKKFEIKEHDNLYTLSQRLSVLSSKLICESLDIIKNYRNDIKSKLHPQTSKNEEIKYARMINKEDYKLDLNDSAKNIDRKVRGLFPRAFIKYKNKNIKITKIRLLREEEIIQIKQESDKKNNLKAGEVLKIYKNEGIIISTKTIPILILEIKIEGKNLANKNQLIQQLNLKIGEHI